MKLGQLAAFIILLLIFIGFTATLIAIAKWEIYHLENHKEKDK